MKYEKTGRQQSALGGGGGGGGGKGEGRGGRGGRMNNSGG